RAPRIASARSSTPTARRPTCPSRSPSMSWPAASSRAPGIASATPEETRLEGALFLVVNKLLAAARTRPGDQASLRAGADYATATISLGLEVVARNDIDRAAEALRTVALGRLFRVGYTVGAKLARLAHGL